MTTMHRACAVAAATIAATAAIATTVPSQATAKTRPIVISGPSVVNVPAAGSSNVVVRLTNRTRVTQRNVRVVVAGPRTVTRQVRPARVTIGPRRSVRVRVNLRTRAATPARVRLTVRAQRGTRIIGVRNVMLRRRATGAPGTPAAPVYKGPLGELVGNYYWTFQSATDRGWDTTAVYFSNDKWAYWGFPRNGLPNCTAPNPEVNKDGTPSTSGCQPFTFNPATGEITVGKREGTYIDGKLKFKGGPSWGMRKLAIPAPGTRVAVSLEHRDFMGFCLMYCTTWQSFLTLNTDGTFRLSGSNLSTVSSPIYFSAAGGSSVNHGTYEIGANGSITMRYADGVVGNSTIAFQRDSDGNPAPATEGLILGSINYYTGK